MEIKVKMKKSFNVNGNPIFNCKITSNIEGKELNLTPDFTSIINAGKVLKNGTINIKEYEFQVKQDIKRACKEKYKNYTIEYI